MEIKRTSANGTGGDAREQDNEGAAVGLVVTEGLDELHAVEALGDGAGVVAFEALEGDFAFLVVEAGGGEGAVGEAEEEDD